MSPLVLTLSLLLIAPPEPGMQATGTRPSSFTGSGMLAKCKEGAGLDSSIEMLWCLGYIAGMVDGYELGYQFTSKGLSQFYACRQMRLATSFVGSSSSGSKSTPRSSITHEIS
jgi:hypothetical protein